MSATEDPIRAALASQRRAQTTTPGAPTAPAGRDLESLTPGAGVEPEKTPADLFRQWMNESRGGVHGSSSAYTEHPDGRINA